MSLKRNSVKLLSWLYQPENSVITMRSVIKSLEATGFRLPESYEYPDRPYLLHSDIPLLLPEISLAGQRSLTGLLQKQQLLEKRLGLQSMHGSKQLFKAKEISSSLYGTSYSRDALRAQLPVFSFIDTQWEGKWTILVFLDSPKSDPAFRYLRTKLLAIKAGQLKSGVYVYPGQLPESILLQLKQLYVGSVVVWQTNEWRFGDERQIVGSIFELSDAFSSLSGVSSELYELLMGVDSQKGLTRRQKQALFMVFDRFVSHIENEIGILPRYFPQVSQYAELLYVFHILYSL